MRSVIYLFLLIIVFSCDNSEKVVDDKAADLQTTTSEESPVEKEEITLEGNMVQIDGNVTGMNPGTKIFLDRKTIDANEIEGSAELDASNQFSIISDIQSPGIFRIRLGARPVWLILEGGEKVQLNAEMDGYKIKFSSVEGTAYDAEMNEWSSEKDEKKIIQYLNKSKEKKALFHAFLLTKLDMTKAFKTFKKVLNEMEEDYPNDNYTKFLATRIKSYEAKMNEKVVAVGYEAPDINLPDPDGNKIKLSSLRGKVVLLDFWASWCRPCRRANPHVVEMYSKYKDQGFDVYNVSLDGIDDRRAAAFNNNAQAIENAQKMENEKWRNAIQTDQLSWKNHVSELRGWSSNVAQLYKVNSIPRTFVLDQKGVIRYENLRGNDLEEAIKTLLAQK